jgi:hypothetical protein
MANYFNLYRADTGALLGKIDLGDGLRGKDWANELPQILLEAATRRGLTNDGYGVLANFPAFVDGRKTQSRPIGENLSTAQPASVSLFKAVSQTAVFQLGDGAVTAWLDAALTQPILATAAYGIAGATTHSDDTLAPRGGRSPAFVSSDTGVANFNLGATDGILTVIVNGTTFTVTVGTGAATTLANIVAAMTTSGIPVITTLHNTNFILLSTPAAGISQTLEVVNTAGTAGAVLFATNGGAQRSGNGSPIGQMDNSDVVQGMKPQRRILPGSMSLATTMAAEVVTSVDTHTAGGNTGVIAGSNAAATATVAGTVNYVTGNVEFDTVGDAPDNATAVNLTYKALIPIDLAEEVAQVQSVGDLALLVTLN